MALAFDTAYAGLITGKITGRRGYLQHVNRSGEVPDGAAFGAISIQYISSVTATTLTDGTMLTDGNTTSQVTGTYVDKVCVTSLPPKQARSSFTSPKWVTQMLEKHADALYTDAQNSLIADLKAGTPSQTSALPTGQIDFVAESEAEAIINLGHAARAVAYMFANFGQYTPSEFAIAVPTAAFGNFTSLRATGVPSPQYFADTGMYSFMGVPIYPIPGATNFGGASNECMFVTHKDSLLFVMDDPELHGGAPIYATDGFVKWITKAPYAHAVVTNFFTQVTNPAS